MVHIETQKVKVLRANQKNAKCLWALHPPTEATADLLVQSCFGLAQSLQGFGLQGFRVSGSEGSGFRVSDLGL